MKVFCAISIFTVLLHNSESASLIRNKRFFNSLWPSEVKDDVQTGLIYAQLPPGYVHMLPGVNDHLQKRADVQQPLPIHPPARFVHPTRMAILMQPHQQPNQQPRPVQPFSANLKTPQPANGQLQPISGPKIVMRPIGGTTKLHPSITLKTKEQSLPDIHKNQRFVQPKPVQSFTQPFNPQQQLPIKKAFDEQDFIEPPTPLLSVHTASIDDFYFTKEFQELLKEFNIKVDISKLPPIHDVMAVMGTENGPETIKAIEEVANSGEGMELIKMYLDQSEGDDEFYNYDDDVGAGEIQVGGTEDVKHVQPYVRQEGIPSQHTVPSPDSVPRATTTGTLTGGGRSWWKPSSWFGGSAKSTKLDSLKKDIDIIQNVVPATGTENYLQYWRKLILPAPNSAVPINPPFNVDGSPRRVYISGGQIPVQFNNPTNIDGAQVMPTIRLTEAQFQDMVEKLKLQPMQRVPQSQRNVPSPTHAPIRQTAAPEPVSQTAAPVTQTPPPVTQTPAPLILKSTTTQAPRQDKFLAPINVPSVKPTSLLQELPLPSTFSEKQALPFQTQPFEFQKGNRRSFVSVSEPQRSSPYDFIATGIIHKANEEEVKKRSRSLVEAAIEGKPDFIKNS